MQLKTPLYFFFNVYNLLFGFVTAFILLYAGIFLNGVVISNKFSSWQDGVQGHSPSWGDFILIMMLIIEGALLMFTLYKINKAFLFKNDIKNYGFEAKRTTLIISLIPLIIILLYIYFTSVENDLANF